MYTRSSGMGVNADIKAPRIPQYTVFEKAIVMHTPKKILEEHRGFYYHYSILSNGLIALGNSSIISVATICNPTL